MICSWLRVELCCHYMWIIFVMGCVCSDARVQLCNYGCLNMFSNRRFEGGARYFRTGFLLMQSSANIVLARRRPKPRDKLCLCGRSLAAVHWCGSNTFSALRVPVRIGIQQAESPANWRDLHGGMTFCMWQRSRDTWTTTRDARRRFMPTERRHGHFIQMSGCVYIARHEWSCCAAKVYTYFPCHSFCLYERKFVD